MRLTMRVVLPHLGQSVLLLVSMTFLRSAVFAIFAPGAMVRFSWSLQYFAQQYGSFARTIVDGMFQKA